MGKLRSETRASLIISSELTPGDEVAQVLELEPSKIVVKGTPTGQVDFPEHPFHVAIFTASVNVEERLERHLAAVLELCEHRQDRLVLLTQSCRVNVHCTYAIQGDGGWTLAQDLCRRMASLPVEYVFAVEALI